MAEAAGAFAAPDGVARIRPRGRLRANTLAAILANRSSLIMVLPDNVNQAAPLLGLLYMVLGGVWYQ